jgi:hypothetical protein
VGAGDFHINADEPSVLAYDSRFKSPAQVDLFYAPDAYRSSDHDPVLVGLSLRAPARRYAFGGFLAPTTEQAQPTIVNAGSSIPIRFTLGANEGLQIFAQGFPASRAVPCAGAGSLTPSSPIATAGASGLTYSSGNRAYSLVWKTDAAWAGSCRELVLRFRDETQQVLRFQFAAP